MVEAESAANNAENNAEAGGDGRVPISDVDDITTSEEMASLFERYPDIDEVEY